MSDYLSEFIAQENLKFANNRLKAETLCLKDMPNFLTRLNSNIDRVVKIILVEDLITLCVLEIFKRLKPNKKLISDTFDKVISLEINDWLLYVDFLKNENQYEKFNIIFNDVIKAGKLSVYDMQDHTKMSINLFDRFYSHKKYYIKIEDFYAWAIKEEVIRVPDFIFLHRSPHTLHNDENDIIFKRKTKLLELLKYADERFWNDFDPVTKKNAPTNQKISETLQVEFNLSINLADAISSILRDDSLPSGRKPKK